jgi:uncharacterized membrane protein HdeD (DUF308 family)
MSTTALRESQQAYSLRNLYFTRTVIQLLWGATVLVEAISNPGLAAVLLIFYPLWDVACTVYDLRTAARPATLHYVNVVFGVLAAAGIALTVFKSPQQAVVTFGAWACAAGLAQLAVGIRRRKEFGGQWAMILSGLQSTVAGVAFILGALSDKTHVSDLGGYAIFGAVYFLIAGFLLSRKLSRVSMASAPRI